MQTASEMPVSVRVNQIGWWQVPLTCREVASAVRSASAELQPQRDSTPMRNAP